MNNKKICFITAVNKEDQYKECVYYISKLFVPSGYEIETLALFNSASLCSAYNEGMCKTDAKYKVYLHQDVLIRNRFFIRDILSVFDDEQIGMIGVAGGTEMPKNGMCFAACNTGFIDEREPGASFFMRPKSNTGGREVIAIDGLIMITQYDIRWRDDIFKGFHYYDISQSFEFVKSGYKIFVPQQDIPWVIHNCNFANLTDYENQAELIIKEYGEFLKGESIEGPSVNYSELSTMCEQLAGYIDNFIKSGQWNDISVIIEKYRKIKFNDSVLEILGIISDIWKKEIEKYGTSPFISGVTGILDAISKYQMIKYGIIRVELNMPSDENAEFIDMILNGSVSAEALIILIINITCDRKNSFIKLYDMYKKAHMKIEMDRLGQIREVIMKSEITYGWM